jgi:acetoin utilization protein AcuC
MESPQPAPKPARQVVLLHSPPLEQFPYPSDCPFNTSRAGLARSMADSMGLLTGPGRREVAPSPAESDAMEVFHTPAYLDALRRAQAGDLDVEALYMGLGTPDNPVFRGMYDYAALACGATLTGVGLLLDAQADVAFNPSGGYHHARPARASGFCYINDVALACLHLAAAGRRVLYLDVDAHHGDGVQDAVYDRRDVMTLSFHESGRTLFPGTGSEDDTGRGEGVGYSVNVPLPVGTYDRAFLKAFRGLAVPLIGAFSPDAVVFELGMDALAGDPLAHLQLTNNAHAAVIEWLMGLGRPVLATGGGGYHVENTARGWAMAWSLFCGEAESVDTHHLGLGGVMMETTDWGGGLRDRAVMPDARVRAAVDAAVDATIERVRRNVFPHHGL